MVVETATGFRPVQPQQRVVQRPCLLPDCALAHSGVISVWWFSVEQVCIFGYSLARRLAENVGVGASPVHFEWKVGYQGPPVSVSFCCAAVVVHGGMWCFPAPAPPKGRIT
jgi:hypothetical protein